MSGIDWGEALKKGFRFCAHPKRWLPFFIIDGIFMTLLLYIAVSNIETLGAALAVMGSNPLSVIQLANFAAIFIPLWIFWILLRLWVTGATIHQSSKEAEFCKSFGVSARRYPSLLLVAILSGVLGMASSMMPVVGYVLSILVGLALFFSMQEVIVGKKGFIKAIQGSWDMFQKRPVRVFLMWLLVSLIGGMVFLVFFMPLMVSLMLIMLPYAIQTGESFAVGASLVYLLVNIQNLIIEAALALIGFATMTVFVIKASTEYYMQSRKKLRVF